MWHKRSHRHLKHGQGVPGSGGDEPRQEAQRDVRRHAAIVGQQLTRAPHRLRRCAGGVAGAEDGAACSLIQFARLDALLDSTLPLSLTLTLPYGLRKGPVHSSEHAERLERGLVTCFWGNVVILLT